MAQWRYFCGLKWSLIRDMDRSTHNFQLGFRSCYRLVFRFSALSLLAFALAGCGGTTVVTTDQYPSPLLDKYPYSAGMVISADFASQVYQETNKDRGMKSVDLGSAQTAILRNVLGAMFTGFEDYETRPESLDVDLLFEPRLEDFQYALPSETSVEVLEVWAKYVIRISDRSGREITDWAVTAYGKTDQRFMASRGTIFGDAVRVAVRDLGANMILGLPRDDAFKSWLDDQSKVSAP